jgi:hypothetical protein
VGKSAERVPTSCFLVTLIRVGFAALSPPYNLRSAKATTSTRQPAARCTRFFRQFSNKTLSADRVAQIMRGDAQKVWLEYRALSDRTRY